jgi:hypothetical protein
MLNQKQITLLSTTREIEVTENSWDRVYIMDSATSSDIYAIVAVMGDKCGYSPDRIQELMKALNSGYGYDYKS